jgi:hypothetical protein
MYAAKHSWWVGLGRFVALMCSAAALFGLAWGVGRGPAPIAAVCGVILVAGFSICMIYVLGMD